MDRAIVRRVVFAALGVLVWVVPVALAGGCAQSREVAERMTAPVGAEDGEERAYDRGYRIGKSDSRRDRPSEYTLHPKDYDATTEKAFAAGFRDGFAGRDNRYGAGEARDWLYGRNSDPDGNR